MKKIDSEEEISIGKLSQATGFEVERLRMWERRYGNPKSLRRPSGHRRYPFSAIEQLLLVRSLMSQGFRAGKVLPLNETQLKELAQRNPSPHMAAQAWLEATRKLDAKGLREAMQRAWNEMGAWRFLHEAAQPYLQALGAAWRSGKVCVAEEHFGSEALSDFLAGAWRSMNEANQGPIVVMTTLPGENHRLGLQMAALVAAMEGRRVLYLGPNTPLEDLPRVAKTSGSKHAVFSISSASSKRRATLALERIRQLLPSDVRVDCGGQGAPRHLENIHRYATLEEFRAALRGESGTRAA